MMKTRRIISAMLTLLFAISVLTGCVISPGAGQDIVAGKCTVNFYINGEEYATKTATIGSAVSMPSAPKREGYIFMGWYIDAGCKMPYDFSSAVLLGFKLYGRFEPDAVAATRKINDEVMSSVVTVSSKCYNAIGGFMETESATSQGSGVIIDISDGYCYVLTNCHVVQASDKFEYQKITVEDAWGNSYDAKIYKHPQKTESAISEKYDLALICFQYKTDNGLTEIKLGEDPQAHDFIVSIGTPEGKKNTVVFGESLEYRDLSKDDNENFKNMTFEVLLHEASLGHGSSGGPIVSLVGELVGINFAGVEDSSWGFAIPISRVREFLDIYVYNK